MNRFLNTGFASAAMAFVLLPGVVAICVPAVWLRLTGGSVGVPGGFMLIGLGLFGLLWCVRDFFVSGKGTLAPWAPPRTLVIVGLYRHSRNPMYVCVLLILAGWAISFVSMGLTVYALVVGIAFHLRVVFGEEPRLARLYGDAWIDYARHVGRWF